MQEERKDRRPRKPNSSVHQPAKKGGAGGNYTWGDSMDVPMDYEPVAVQPVKVSMAQVSADTVPPPTMKAAPSATPLGAQPDFDAQFPALTPNPAAPAKPTTNLKADAPWGAAWGAALRQVPPQPARQDTAEAMGFVATLRARAGATLAYMQEITSKRVTTPIKARVALVTSAAAEAADCAKALMTSAKGLAASTYTSIKDKGLKLWAVETVQLATASELAAGVRNVAKDKSFQTTTALAAGGAVAMGAGGALTGLSTGTVIGTAVGIVPALFTFGLSIPIGAAIGGGAGLVMGAVVGTTVGAVGGGAAGYGMYVKRDQIAGVASQTLAKDRAAAVRAWFVGGGTGSTEDRD